MKYFLIAVSILSFGSSLAVSHEDSEEALIIIGFVTFSASAIIDKIEKSTK